MGVKPSWKNQKADAPVIELGKGNRNLVMGVTGTHTSINLGGREAVGCFAQMSGIRFRCQRLHNLKTQDPCPACVQNSFSMLQRPRPRRVPGPGCLSGEPPVAWATRPTPEQTLAARGWLCSHSHDLCRVLLSVIYHSDGANKFKTPGNLCL